MAKKEPPELVPDSFQHVIGMTECYAKSGKFKLRTLKITRKGKREELGFFLREGDGWNRRDGIFISRVKFGSVFDVCNLVSVGEEVVKIDDKDVKDMNIGEAIRYIYDCKELSITLKIITPFATKRAGKRWRKTNEPEVPVSRVDDYKVLNMRIGLSYKERHVYVPSEEKEENVLAEGDEVDVAAEAEAE